MRTTMTNLTRVPMTICLKFHNKRIWNLHWRREWC